VGANLNVRLTIFIAVYTLIAVYLLARKITTAAAGTRKKGVFFRVSAAAAIALSAGVYFAGNRPDTRLISIEPSMISSKNYGSMIPIKKTV